MAPRPSPLELLLSFQLSPLQRVLFIWAFVICGLVLSFHVSQFASEVPVSWARLNKETRQYWYAVYGLQALLLLQIASPVLVQGMEGYAFGFEEKLLNGIWIGLLGLEALMVFGVLVKSVASRMQTGQKVKTS